MLKSEAIDEVAIQEHQLKSFHDQLQTPKDKALLVTKRNKIELQNC